jgi:hypothetical protein
VSDWCTAHDVSIKSYYYWLRKIKREAFDAIPAERIPKVPTVASQPSMFAEIPHTTANLSSSTAVIIRLGNTTLEIQNGADQETIENTLRTIRHLVKETSPKVFASYRLDKAFQCANNQKEGLMNYLLDGNCSISNNQAENGIRPFTIGRKNWLFSGSPKGAEANTGIYTLVETAKANGLNPCKYIKFILSDIPGTSFLEYPEYLEEYMLWDPMVQ